MLANKHQAISIYEALSDAQDPESMYFLSNLYSEGVSEFNAYSKKNVVILNQDISNSVKLLTSAAQLGHKEAKYKLAEFHQNIAERANSPAEYKKHHTAAFKLYKELSDLGLYKPKARLASYYKHGIVVAKNLETAYDLYSEAASAKVLYAINSLQQSEFIAIAETRRLKKLQQEMAQDLNFAEILLIDDNPTKEKLTLAYNSIIDVSLKCSVQSKESAAIFESVYSRAKDILTSAKKSSNTVILEALACSCHNTFKQHPHITSLFEIELELKTKAAEIGSVESKFSLFKYYSKGLNLDVCGVKKKILERDIEKSSKYLKECLEQDYPEAQMELADNLLHRKDINKAIIVMKTAADQGLTLAKYKLATLYLKHKQKSNYKEAIKLLTEEADKGHAESQFILGRLYYHGKVLEKNLDEAESWIIRAAINGLESAINFLTNNKFNKVEYAKSYALEHAQEVKNNNSVVTSNNIASNTTKKRKHQEAMRNQDGITQECNFSSINAKPYHNTSYNIIESEDEAIKNILAEENAEYIQDFIEKFIVGPNDQERITLSAIDKDGNFSLADNVGFDKNMPVSKKFKQ